MKQHTLSRATKASTNKRLSFAPINRGQWGRDASLPEGFPVTVQISGNETRLHAWVDAPLEEPADYFYVAQPGDFTPASASASTWDSLEAMELHVINEISAAGATPRRFDIGFIIDAAFTWDSKVNAFVQKPGKSIAWASHWARLY